MIPAQDCSQCKQGHCEVVPPCSGNEISLLSVETSLPSSVVVLGLFIIVNSLPETIKFEVIHNAATSSFGKHHPFLMSSMCCFVGVFFKYAVTMTTFTHAGNPLLGVPGMAFICMCCKEHCY